MSDIKKFLDYEGVKHLWSKINMNDYPNNETLINVINAIDETKADRSELVQSDWNENDETAINYIKSRTHYENIVTTSIVLVDEEVELIQPPDMMSCSFWSEPIALENGKTYTVIVNGVKQEIVCENDKLIFVDAPETGDTLTLGSEIIFGNIEYTYHIKIETTEISTIVKQLDEKYIPDTIARTEDIPSTAIKPFPYYAVNKVGTIATQYKVNLEELETGILYSFQEKENPDTSYTWAGLSIVCDDGTEAIIINFDRGTICSIRRARSKINIYSMLDGEYWSVDISDKSTANNVLATYSYSTLGKYLSINNTDKYTPTDDYNPATKKYVDDTATTAANAIKNDLLNGASEAYDTLKELGELIDDNVDAIEALEIIATGKANVSDIPTKVSQLANDSGYITEAPQADWTQTDETATNYIKNKPILATSEEIKALFN